MRKGTVDLVFANEAELHSLYQTSDFDSALKQLRADAKLGVVTRSEKGCVVAANDGAVAVPALADRKAGRYHRRRRSVRRRLPVRPGRATPAMRAAGRLGALAAAEVIQHIGARPQVSLKDLAQQSRLPREKKKKRLSGFLSSSWPNPA